MSGRPPVIPEIAKAYENDPRTQMAIAAMKAGSSTAPVAAGGYGYADGIARVLQGLGGAYMDKKTQDKYGTDEAALLALRKARGVDGLTGTGAIPGVPSMAAPMTADPSAIPVPTIAPAAPLVSDGSDLSQGAPPPQAAAIAAALGSPAPQGGPPAGAGAPGLPMAAIPAAVPPVAPGNGGGPMGRPPFGPTAAPPVSGALAPEVVPDAPQAVARPVAPAPVGAVRSPMLDAAYKVMSDANPYESATGQDMYGSGLEAQSKLNESAAERAAKLSDMGYQADLGNFEDSQQAARTSAYAERTAAQNRNFERSQTGQQEQFTGGENDKNRSNALTLENMRASSALAVAKVKEADVGSGGVNGLTPEERKALADASAAGKLDISKVTKFQAKVIAQALIDNPGLDAIHLHAYATLAASPAAQQKGMLIQAVPTLLTNVRDAGKKLNFSDAQFVGKLQAFTNGQLNDPNFASYMSQRNDAMQTLAQVMSGVGATDMRTKMESDAAPKTMSPRAWDGWYQGQVAAIRPRIQSYEQKGLVDKGTTAALDAAASGAASAPATGGGWGKATVVQP